MRETEARAVNSERRAQAIRRIIENYGPPGEAIGRKLYLLEHVEHILLRDYGAAPRWVDEIRTKVEVGRL